MRKIGLIARERIVDEVGGRVQGSKGCFFVNFNKVTALGMTKVRNDLHRIGSRVFVAKNSLVKRAFDQAGLKEFDSFLGAETSIVFAYEDLVGACKILVDYAKEDENFTLKGGFLQDKVVSTDQIKNLAKLPSHEVLLGMAVGAMASPLTGFVRTLNQVITKFVWALEEIKKKET